MQSGAAIRYGTCKQGSSNDLDGLVSVPRVRARHAQGPGGAGALIAHAKTNGNNNTADKKEDAPPQPQCCCGLLLLRAAAAAALLWLAAGVAIGYLARTRVLKYKV